MAKTVNDDKKVNKTTKKPEVLKKEVLKKSSKKVEDILITAMQFYVKKGIHPLYERFVKKQYKNSDKRTVLNWEKEFEKQKIS